MRIPTHFKAVQPTLVPMIKIPFMDFMAVLTIFCFCLAVGVFAGFIFDKTVMGMIIFTGVVLFAAFLGVVMLKFSKSSYRSVFQDFISQIKEYDLLIARPYRGENGKD